MGRRTGGMTLLALALGWVGLGGIGTSFLVAADGFEGMLPTWMAYICGAYGLSAIATCMGIMGMQRWAVFAFWLWATAAVLSVLSFLLVVPSELVMGGHLAGLVFVAIFAWLLYLVGRWLQRAMA